MDEIRALLGRAEPVRWVFTGDSITHGAAHTIGWRDYTELFDERARKLPLPEDLTGTLRRYICCHEVGHTLGLDHQDVNFNNANLGTCMDYTNDPSTNQHPNQHDYDELVTIYSHLDSTTTVGAATTAGAPSVGNDAGTWGRRVEGSRSSGHSTYVRDFGGGNLVITFVSWA